MAAGPVDKLTAHVVQNYQVTGEISRDAFSRLFQATSPSLGSAVIIQVIPGELARDPEFGDRFEARMRKAANLAHRNILRINHYVHEDPNYYLVLDYFGGQPLAQVIEARAPLPPPEVVSLLTQALEAIDHAHKNGIAHGALHPGGMLVADDGELRLTGFGIAKAIDPQTMLVETPDNPYPFKSPEQALGLPVDARSDLYSMGVIAWQALTAKLPPATESVPPPSSLNDQVSPELDEVVLRMLVSRPRDRFRTARQVATAVSRAVHAPKGRGGRPKQEEAAPPVAVLAAPQPSTPAVAPDVVAAAHEEDEIMVAVGPAPDQQPAPPQQVVSAVEQQRGPAATTPATQPEPTPLAAAPAPAGADLVLGAEAAQPAPAPPAAEPLRPRTRAERGIDAFRSGNIQDAVRLLEEAREEMPRSIRVLTYLGAAYYAAKRYADAENALTRALAMRPDLATVRYNLANALLAQGKRAAAKVELQKAWDQDPTCTPALLVLVSLEGTPES